MKGFEFYKHKSKNVPLLVLKMRIGFFVWEYPPALVGGLGTYAEYITREYVAMGNDVTVFTLNLKTK